MTRPLIPKLTWLRGTAYALLPAVLSIVCCAAGRAQQKLPFDHLTVKQGLSQGSVNCILQDSRGYMWFGTQDGLNKFDGYGCAVFKHDPADPATISDNWVLSIVEDSAGALWIRTLNSPGVLSRLDRLTESFTQVPADSLRRAGARINSVKAECDEPSGVQWRGTIGGGLTRYDPATGKTTAYKHDPADPNSLSDDRVYSVYRDRSGTIWAGTKEGLDRIDPATGTMRHFRHEEKNPESLSDNWVWPILEDRSGVLWVGTYRGGLNRFDRATETFSHYKHDDGDPRSIGGDQIYSLFQDHSGMIWVGLLDHGVDRFHPELGAFARIAHDPADAAGLSDNNILCMYADRQGTSWIGTRGGVDLFEHSTGIFRHYRNLPTDPRSIGDNQAQCFLEDRAGNMWIGMVSSGLDRFDRASGIFTHYRNDPANAASLSDNRVYALSEDHEGMLWIGTYGGGLNRFDPATKTFTRFVHDDSISSSLSVSRVFALVEDRQNTLWVGTFGGGLDRFDRDTRTFTHFRHSDSVPGSLSDDVVACLYEDRSGILWAGTTGGLNRFDRSSGTFKHFREKDGLANDVIFGILEDGKGNLWLSTNKGVSRFDPRAGTFRNFDYNDGLQGDEFNQNAYARDPVSGEMYFGGSNGFNVFQPDSVRDNPYVPPVVFSSFRRYNTDDKEGKPIVEKGIDAKPEVMLSYKDNVTSFEFAALNYYNNFKNRYAYRLEGYSENWIQLGTERKATFTNLDAGEYTLHVKGSNNDGLWNDAGAVLRLTVRPPWWKTRWAYAGYLLCAFGVLSGVRRVELNRREQKAQIRESQLRAKAVEAEKRALEAENERKTRELDDARQLQLSMLPKEVPKHPDYDIAVFMKTATEVGGDYYDFISGSDGSLNVGFGDATGHGMQAGTIVTLMKGLFISDASRFDLRAFLNHCSAAIKEIKLGRLFMAFTLVRLRGNAVSFASAGMPPAFLYRKEGGTVEEVFLKGMPLGAMKKFPYTSHDAELKCGDTILLLTDGLPEQKNAGGAMYDYARVQEGFAAVADQSPDAIIGSLVRSGETWMNGALQEDDITLMVIKRKAQQTA